MKMKNSRKIGRYLGRSFGRWLSALTPASFAPLAALCAIILPAVLLAYALAAGQARALFTAARAQRALNRVAGAVMAGVAVAVAAR